MDTPAEVLVAQYTGPGGGRVSLWSDDGYYRVVLVHPGQPPLYQFASTWLESVDHFQHGVRMVRPAQSR